MFSSSRREFLSRSALATAAASVGAAIGVVAGTPAPAHAAPMIKCPFCGFSNEDGALFCEQCKSDLSDVPPQPAPTPGK